MDITGTTEGLLFGQQESVQIALGSVGWEGEDSFEDQGTDANDGYTLVRVQLFEGRDITKPLSNRAQGYKVVCMLSSGITRTPPKDTRVYVAFPKGMENIPGAGVIIAAVEKRPKQVGNTEPGDLVIHGPEGSNGVIALKTNGTVAIGTKHANGSTVALSVSPNGMFFTSPFGSFRLDFSGYHLKVASGARIDMGGITIPIPGADALASALTGYCNITAPSVNVAGGMVTLGKGATYGMALQALPATVYLAPGAPGSSPVTTSPTFASPNVRIAAS